MTARIDIDAALALLHREGRQYSWRIAISVATLGLGLVLFLLGTRLVHTDGPLRLLPLLAALGCTVGGALLVPRSTSRATEALAAIDDVRAIGPLAEALPSAVGEKHTAIVDLLTILLRRLQTGDREMLTSAQRQALVEALGRAYLAEETDFVIALVDALDRIGAGEATGIVVQLASLPIANRHEDVVRKAAMACLPSFESHALRHHQSQTLLHPASAAEPATLLRAAPTESTPSDVLLRPDSTIYLR